MPQGVTLKVIFEDPQRVVPPTLFSNHVGISRAGTEVQFEFVAVDINLLANTIAEHAASGSRQDDPVEISGRTVAKIVVPLHVFLQLESHLTGLFDSVRKEFASTSEVTNERAIP